MRRTAGRARGALNRFQSLQVDFWGVRCADHVLHRAGCSQEDQQLLRERWRWHDSRRWERSKPAPNGRPFIMRLSGLGRNMERELSELTLLFECNEEMSGKRTKEAA
jgi:hypothetical protein